MSWCIQRRKKKVEIPTKEDFFSTPRKGRTEERKGKTLREKEKGVRSLESHFQWKKRLVQNNFLSRHFLSHPSSCPKCSTQYHWWTDKLTNSSEKVQVKIVEEENILPKRRKRRNTLGWKMILDSEGEGDFLGYARFQCPQIWTGKPI